MASRDILRLVGHTSLQPLRYVAPSNGARVLLKLENDLTGSMKDRMAVAMIEAAEADGRLPAGGSVVEYTGGSTGVSLALVCAVKRYHQRDGGSRTPDCRRHRRVLDRPAPQHRSDCRLSADGGRNLDADRRIDGFVQSVGTAASLRGTAEALRRYDTRIRVAAVEPSESSVLSGGSAGAHKIDGIGAGFVVPLWRPEIVDRIEQVSTQAATAMSLRLAREEGLFAGVSTGANVVAALRLAEHLGPTATVVTVMCDTGMKYLHTLGKQLAAEGT